VYENGVFEMETVIDTVADAALSCTIATYRAALVMDTVELRKETPLDAVLWPVSDPYIETAPAPPPVTAVCDTVTLRYFCAPCSSMFVHDDVQLIVDWYMLMEFGV
jgi:hypothetical protein